MGKSKTTGKHRLDKFYRLAKDLGYRSRAAFKLVQLNRKYDFLGKATTLLDLCAAPGGWLQVAAKHMPVGSTIVGVDLVAIRPIKGCTTLVQDITTTKCRTELKKVFKGRPVDVVIHDGAPNVGGAFSSEQFSQVALSLESLRVASEHLGPGGIFVSKVFRSQDYNAFLFACNQLFDKVESTKPVASRHTSAEIYVVCMGYKAPKKIDPRLLDPKHLFKQVEDDETPVVNVLRQNLKKPRSRSGYGEEGAAAAYRTCSALSFLESQKPVELLGTVGSIDFSGEESRAIANHEKTTQEVKDLCADLHIIAKRDFKTLLKWRLAVRKDILETPRQDRTVDEPERDDEDEDPEEKVLEEIAGLQESDYKRMRSLKKKKQKLKAKLKQRTLGNSDSDATIAQDDGSLFSLGAVRTQKELEELETMDDDIDADDDEEQDDPNEEDEYADLDEDERYEALIEENLDALYTEYQEMKTSRSRRAKKAKFEDGGELFEDNIEARNGDDEPSVEESDQGDKNPLLVDMEEDESKPVVDIQKQWFSQPIFQKALGMDRTAVQSQSMSLRGSDKLAVPRRHGDNGSAHTTVAPGSLDDDEDSGKDDHDFEVVPMEGGDPIEDDDSGDSDDSVDEGYDSDEKAEIRAYGLRMLRRKQKEEMIEQAYNRYAFEDEHVPLWLKQEEKKFYRANLNLSASEKETAKSALKSIDTRPVKRVAEAKARKRKQAMKKLAAANEAATKIADMEGGNARSKAREISKLYSKLKRQNAKSDEKQKSKKKFDRRMLADIRGEKKKLKKMGIKSKKGSKSPTKPGKGRRK